MTDDQIQTLRDELKAQEAHVLYGNQGRSPVHPQLVDALRAALALTSRRCGNCGHFLPWDRQTMQGTGDCTHWRHRGRRNGQSPADGCILGWVAKS